MMVPFQPLLATNYGNFGLFIVEVFVLAPCVGLTGVCLIVALARPLRPSIRGMTGAVLGVLMMVLLLISVWMLGSPSVHAPSDGLWVGLPPLLLAAVVWGIRRLGLALLRRDLRKQGRSEIEVEPKHAHGVAGAGAAKGLVEGPQLGARARESILFVMSLAAVWAGIELVRAVLDWP